MSIDKQKRTLVEMYSQTPSTTILNDKSVKNLFLTTNDTDVEMYTWSTSDNGTLGDTPTNKNEPPSKCTPKDHRRHS